MPVVVEVLVVWRTRVLLVVCSHGQSQTRHSQTMAFVVSVKMPTVVVVTDPISGPDFSVDPLAMLHGLKELEPIEIMRGKPTRMVRKAQWPRGCMPDTDNEKPATLRHSVTKSSSCSHESEPRVSPLQEG